MKKVKIMMILGICALLGANAFAAGRHNYNPGHYQRGKNVQNIKMVRHAPAKVKPQPVVKKTVVVHHYEKPRYHHSPAAETAALVGLGIIATAVIAKAIF